MNDFRQWAERVKLEIEAPDLWAEAQKYQSIFSLPTQDKIEDIPFSHSEAEQISIALKQFEQTIIDEFGLVGDQLEYVQQKLSYLESKAKEGCPRVDWVNMSIGVLTSIATNLALDPAKAHQLWIAFTEALRPVFQFLLG